MSELESAIDEIKRVLIGNKSREVEEVYLKNAIRYIREYGSQPTLNENQQIVLDWLREEKSKNPELSIFGTLSVLFDESENRFMSLDVIDALNDLSNKQQADVFQSFSQWTLEQEEE